MKQNYIAFMAIILITIVYLNSKALAQLKTANSKITGNVIDEEQKPLDYVTISLLRAKDSSLVKTSITDLNGMYSFENIAAGNYLASATLMGYKKSFSQPFELNDSQKLVTIPKLRLSRKQKSEGSKYCCTEAFY